MIDIASVRSARPAWLRTGFRFFPYAAVVDGAWWVLRVNHGFPEHDLLTLFVDGAVVVDVTPGGSSSPFDSGLARLDPLLGGREPLLDAATARTAIAAVAGFADYGSENGDACDFCFRDKDGYARM
ncbi:hypothetical protein ACXYTP_09320 [Tsukamurella ocularis]|uniref:hypothetical protein n=1 Tax=Tsukamurella ocularis TaxID=1970234 RepID=UPI0039EF2E78